MTLRIAPLALAGLTVLCATNAWLVAQMSEALVGDDRTTIASIEWKPKLSTATEGMPAVRSIAAYEQTLARPAFFKTREPFVARAPTPPAPPPPPRPPPPPDPGVLVGGVMINASTKKAYLVKKPELTGTWVREGDEFMGWKVQSINAGTTRLQNSGHTIELHLYAPAVTSVGPR